MAWHWHTSPPRDSLRFGHVDFLQSSEHAMPTVVGLLCTIFSVWNALCSPPYTLVFPPPYLLVWLLHNLQISAEACLSCSPFQNSAWSTARAVYLFFWMSTLIGTLLHGYLASSEVQECKSFFGLCWFLLKEFRLVHNDVRLKSSNVQNMFRKCKVGHAWETLVGPCDSCLQSDHRELLADIYFLWWWFSCIILIFCHPEGLEISRF